MKKRMASILSALLCMLVLAGCGDEKTLQSVELSPETQVTEEESTQPSTQAPTTLPTEPEPVYELQTVYLCVREKMHKYEGGDFLKGYSYDSYGRKTEYFGISDDGSRSWVTQYSYDENGNLIEERTGDSFSVFTYDEAGRLVSKLSYYQDKCNAERYYVYDEAGFVIEETRIERYSDEVTYFFVMTYDENHTQCTIEQFRNGEPNGITAETYNSDGQVLSSTVHDANGDWKRTSTWTYDDTGRLLQEGTYSRSETQADYLTIYIYDENGLLVSKNVDYYYGYLLEFFYEPVEILVRVK